MSGPEDGHTFEVTVRMRGSFEDTEGKHADADWWSDLSTVSVRAFDLRTALHQAAELPLQAYFRADEEPKEYDTA